MATSRRERRHGGVQAEPTKIVEAMNNNMERKHLVQAERHIAECKNHIARQREVIEELRKDDHETDVIESMLHALR
jgi:ferritin-like metal-binding protein YciE